MQLSSNPNSPFASVTGLGALRSEHPRMAGSRSMSFITGFVFLASGPVLLLIAAYMYFDALNRLGPVRANASSFWAPLLVCPIVVLIGLWTLFQAWWNWSPPTAALYEGGFARNDRKGLKQVRWDDIDVVWQSATKNSYYGIPVATTYLYTIQLRDSTRIELDSWYSRIEELGKGITVGAANALLPRYAAALQSGQRVSFGPLAMDARRLYSGNKSLLWSEIEAIKIDQGTISVEKEGSWFDWTSVTVPQVPNFWVFYDLVSRFTKVE